MTHGSNGGSPAASEPLTLAASLRVGLRACLHRPLIAFVALPLLVAVAVGGCLVPRFNFLYLLVGLAPTVGGIPVVALALVDGCHRTDDRPLRFASIMEGFRRYERYLALFWIAYLLLIASAIPLLIAAWVDRYVTPPSARLPLLGLAASAGVVLALALLHRYAFAFLSAADLPRDRPVAEVLTHAASLVDGRRAVVLPRLATLAVVGLTVALLPVALAASAALYRSLAPPDAPVLHSS